MKKGQLDSHILVLVTLGLTAFGLVMVYSATSAPAALGGSDPVFYLKREAHLRADRRRAARWSARRPTTGAPATSRRC